MQWWKLWFGGRLFCFRAWLRVDGESANRCPNATPQTILFCFLFFVFVFFSHRRGKKWGSASQTFLLQLRYLNNSRLWPRGLSDVHERADAELTLFCLSRSVCVFVYVVVIGEVCEWGGGSPPITHNCSAWERVRTSLPAPGRGQLKDPRGSFVALRLFNQRASIPARAPFSVRWLLPGGHSTFSG